MKWFIKGLILLIATQYWGCRKECPCDDPTNKECPNYDPCLSVQKPTANFKMRYANPSFPDREGLIAEYCDTIWGGAAQFEAEMKDALEYSWKIGSDSRSFNSKTFKLGFTSYIEDTLNNLQDNKMFFKPLEIKLKVKSKPNNCWPDLDTLTEQTKKLYFVNGNANFGNFSYFGKYEGRFENDIADREITIEKFDMPITGITKTRFINIPGYDTFISAFTHFSERLVSFKTMYYPITSPVEYKIKWYDWLNGLIYFRIDRTYSPDGRHSINLEYRIINQAETEIKTYKFKGRKLL